ncbi:MAG: hypothetical protein ACLUYV_04965 [Alistipes shahii]
MTETLLMLYTMFAAAGTFALLSLLGAVELRARRQRSRDAALRAKYLRIVMLYLLAGEGPAPRFPMISPCRRPAAARRDRRRTCRRHLRTGRRAPAAHRRGVRTRRLAAPPHGPLPGLPPGALPAAALSPARRRSRGGLRRALCREPQPLRAFPVADGAACGRSLDGPAADGRIPRTLFGLRSGEIMAVLRRGMLPIAYEPLIGSPSRNLRIVGLNIVRQFGIEEAERLLLRIVSGDEDPELVREALYTLCALRRPLTRRAVSGRLSAMPPAERKALLRYVVAEGYSPGPLRRLLDERERPYYESLVQTYKRSLA